jgi:hypothetical protein
MERTFTDRKSYIAEWIKPRPIRLTDNVNDGRLDVWKPVATVTYHFSNVSLREVIHFDATKAAALHPGRMTLACINQSINQSINQ